MSEIVTIDLMEYIRPELYILIIVSYLIGIVFKKSSVKDSLIPLYLSFTSVILATIYLLGITSVSSYQDIMMCIFSGVTQGILCAAVSVYINQLIKQTGSSDEVEAGVSDLLDELKYIVTPKDDTEEDEEENETDLDIIESIDEIAPPKELPEE